MSVTRSNIETLNKYTDRIETLNKQLNQLSKNSKEYNRVLQEKLRLEKRAAKTSAELSSNVGRLIGQVPNHKKLINEASSAQKRFNSTQEQSSKSTKTFFNRLVTATGTLFRYSLAYKAINAASRLFNELFIESAKRAIELEKALADVAAVANLTAAEMDRLEKVVFDVAGTTSLTAIEVVELQKQLAKLGTTVDELEDLTKPVALLSQALGEEPGGVAATLKKVLNQFQETTEQADRFANALVGAVNESALSLNDLGTALQYVGPLASQSGLTFEYTASLLGVLADNGFRASRAGTGLRNVLLEAAKDGRPFAEFLEDLAVRNLDVAEATELFGKRGASAAIVLANNTKEVAALNEELKENTRLLTANAKQMSSTQGQIDLLSSAYNRASIRLGGFITETEFFIELLERLDPEVSAQARAFKFIANASEEGQKSFDDLTTSLIGFGNTQEENTRGLDAQLNILREAYGFSEDRLKLLKSQYILEKLNNEQLTFSNFLQGKSKEELKDAGDLLSGLIDISADRAKTLREQRIAEEAQNENYKEAVALKERLTQAAKEGNLTDEEQLRVNK